MGIGLHHSLGIGLLIGTIESRIKDLESFISMSLLKHNVRTLGSLNKKENRELILQTSEIAKRITVSINKEIDDTNEIILKRLNIKQKIKRINLLILKKLIKQRFKSFEDESEKRSLNNENFRIKFDLLLSQTSKSTVDLIDYIEELETYKLIKGINKNYIKYIIEAKDIGSIGYHNTSIFVMGRAIENLLDDLIRKAIKEKKLKKLNLKKIKYDSKIGILKNIRIIDEKTFHDLNSIRIDRNKTGHPSRVKNKLEENKVFIQKTILLIIKLQKKLNQQTNPIPSKTPSS